MRNHTASPPTYWQIAAGDEGRNYTQTFIDYGIAFAGGYDNVFADIREHDRILLKQGLSKVIAVGRVVCRNGKANGVGDKAWLLDFDGWRLPAYCYVEWHLPETPIKVTGLCRGTVTRVSDAQKHLWDCAERAISDLPSRKEYLPDPPDTEKVGDDEILQFLVRQGVRPGAADELAQTIRRIRLLAGYYYETDGVYWADIREHETRTFLVIPFLLALGWTERQIKIELGIANRKRVDIACFSRPYHRDKNGDSNDADCTLLIETKGFTQGLDYAPDQVKEYARYFEKCDVVVVTNGYCYKAYRRQGHGFADRPSAYLNLLDPRDRYPLDPNRVNGSLALLRLLLPPAGEVVAR